MIRSHHRAVLVSVLALASAAPFPSRAEPVQPGGPAPDFTLTDTDGKQHHLGDYLADGKTVVLEWFNPDCPFVKKHHKTYDTMRTTRASNPDVVWLAINSGAPGKQGHGLDHNRKAKAAYGMDYPVLLDEDGRVGRLYGAKTTPHMFVIAKGVLVYAGAIDDNPSPAGKPGKTNHVATTLTELAEGKDVDVSQTKSYGCSVKYGPDPASAAMPQ